MANVIRLNSAQIDKKIAELKTIQSSLKEEALLTGLPFGAGGGQNSSGMGVIQYSQLNAEFGACIQKLAALVEATIQYLQNVKATFEEADNALGRT